MLRQLLLARLVWRQETKPARKQPQYCPCNSPVGQHQLVGHQSPPLPDRLYRKYINMWRQIALYNRLYTVLHTWYILTYSITEIKNESKFSVSLLFFPIVLPPPLKPHQHHTSGVAIAVLSSNWMWTFQILSQRAHQAATKAMANEAHVTFQLQSCAFVFSAYLFNFSMLTRLSELVNLWLVWMTFNEWMKRDEQGKKDRDTNRRRELLVCRITIIPQNWSHVPLEPPIASIISQHNNIIKYQVITVFLSSGTNYWAN